MVPQPAQAGRLPSAPHVEQRPSVEKADATGTGLPVLVRHGQNERVIALGRRNALFAGSSRGAEAWAILSSIINTAKLHELDPQTYLADVLEKIVSGQTKVNSLHELLPWAWKEARTQQTAAAA